MHMGCGLIWERRKFGCGDPVLEVVLIALGRRKRTGVVCGGTEVRPAMVHYV